MSNLKILSLCLVFASFSVFAGKPKTGAKLWGPEIDPVCLASLVGLEPNQQLLTRFWIAGKDEGSLDWSEGDRTALLNALEIPSELRGQLVGAVETGLKASSHAGADPERTFRDHLARFLARLAGSQNLSDKREFVERAIKQSLPGITRGVIYDTDKICGAQLPEYYYPGGRRLEQIHALFAIQHDSFTPAQREEILSLSTVSASTKSAFIDAISTGKARIGANDLALGYFERGLDMILLWFTNPMNYPAPTARLEKSLLTYLIPQIIQGGASPGTGLIESGMILTSRISTEK